MSKYSERFDSVSIDHSDYSVSCRDYVSVGIACDCCHAWFHDQCCGLTTERLSFYRDEVNEAYKWFCMDFSKSISERLSIQDDRISLIDTLLFRLTILEGRSKVYDKTELDLKRATQKIEELEGRLNECK